MAVSLPGWRVHVLYRNSEKMVPAAMTDALSSHSITCPHCWEPHEIQVDASGGDQTYIEDCSVCCHPIELTVHFAGDELSDVSVEAAQ